MMSEMSCLIGLMLQHHLITAALPFLASIIEMEKRFFNLEVHQMRFFWWQQIISNYFTIIASEYCRIRRMIIIIL